ncbi:hypothetical protein HBA54_03210 [Pelagibius litoralis]|uniref:Uncharacterized protein n=1 Tax=Pelagibius litoralis TaxID=374515 RepID=A0A967C1P6_9PROT|nr:hypothetical protein [Pelagibius litoralis]NIA67591.1 hypothetical protein [Pelagibius litoralis]
MNADGRFADTGMRVDEALARARKWWGEYRGAVRRDFNRTRKAPKARLSAKASNFVIQGEEEEPVPSGILSGQAWDDLSQREQLLIVKQWHHDHVRAPLIDKATVAKAVIDKAGSMVN